MLRWLRNRLLKTTEPESSQTLQREPVEKGERWSRLEGLLGFQIEDFTLYRRALRHRSIIDEDLYEKHETYERLEFLGDAVLDLVITEILFEAFPTQDEGFMTKLRAKLVKGETLAELARTLALNELLEVGKRAEGQGIELSRSVLADVFESLIAAIYLSEGYHKAYQFVAGVVDKHLDLEKISGKMDNFKSALLELTQAHKLGLPNYRVVQESGPGHDKTFDVVVSVDDRDYGSGSGKNKKEAEQIAARQAFATLQQNLQNMEDDTSG